MTISSEKRKGYPAFVGDEALQAMVGTANKLECDASAGNFTVPSATGSDWTNCREIYADSAGIAKIDFKNDQGISQTEVLYMIAGLPYHYRNITKVYQNYKTGTVCTAKYYNNTGSLIVGIKIRR